MRVHITFKDNLKRAKNGRKREIMKCKLCKAEGKMPDGLCDECLSGIDALITKMLDINRRVVGVIHPSQTWEEDKN